MDWEKSICHLHWTGSIRMLHGNGGGNTFFPQNAYQKIPAATRCAGIISMKVDCNGRYRKRYAGRSSQSQPVHTRFATVSQHTFWRLGMISGRCRNCSDIKM